jgi:maternal-effect protein exuperantia
LLACKSLKTHFSHSVPNSHRALSFRTALANAKHTKASMQEVYTNEKREGFEKLVKELEGLKDDEREELINLLEHHFDEEKQPLKPLVKRRPGRNGNYRRRRYSSNNGMQNGGSNQRMQNGGGNNQRMQNGNYNSQEDRRANSGQRRPNPRYNNRNRDGRRRFNSNRNGNPEKDGMPHKDQPQQETAIPVMVAAN